jgi:hypothetical protein
MLAALGMVAYIASIMTHEALGHGGYCLAAGGHNTMLTAWWETCRFPGTAPLGIKAAGPGLQFGAGLMAWMMLHLTSPKANRFRFLLWLYMVFSLLISSGYVAFSGITGLGDAAEMIARLRPAVYWRAGLFLLGGVLYFVSMRVAAFELKRWAGFDDRIERLFRLVWIPYVAAGLLACFTGLLTQTMDATGLAVAAPAMSQAMGRGSALALAALSSFGAGSGMFGLPNMQGKLVSREISPAVYLARSAAWGLAAATAIIAFLIFIGPGLR